MWIGPIHPVLLGLTTGHNPIKSIKVSTTSGKQVVLFDQEYSYALQSQSVEVDAGTIVYEASPANAMARLTQIVELTQNAEWQRCGLFIQWREDGGLESEDGWYNLRPIQVSDEFIYSSYGEFTISVDLRARQRLSAGVYVDSKAVPNDANLAGVGLAAIPMGMSTQYPAATWTFVGANGNIPMIENPVSVLRTQLVTPINTQTIGRCALTDEA